MPRGSDQFWYIVDAESVSKGVFTTNNIFPNSLPSDNSDLRPFVQNRPIVYIAGSLIKLGFSSVNAYKTINLISYFLIVFILLHSLKLINVDSEFILSAMLFFTASPLIIFSIYNPLTNLFDAMLFALFVTCCFYFFKKKKTFFGRIIIFCGIINLQTLLIYERSDFLFYTCIIFLLLSLESIIKRHSSVFSGLSVLLLFFGCQVIVSSFGIFPQHLAGKVPMNSLVLTNVNNSIGSMVSYLGSDSDFIQYTLLDILFLKSFNFLNAVKEFPNLIAFLYLLLGFIPFFKNGLYLKKWKLFEFLSVLIVLMLIVLLFTFQFQYRYIVFFIAPTTLILFQNLNIANCKLYLRIINLSCVFLFIVFNVFIYRSLETEGKLNLGVLKKVESLKISSNSKVAIVYDGGSALIWSWLFADLNRLYYIRRDKNESSTLKEFDVVIFPISYRKNVNKEESEYSIHSISNFILKIKKY